jgi:hypothetical protein
VGRARALAAALVLFVTLPAGASEERPKSDGSPATANMFQWGLGGVYGLRLSGPEPNPWAFGLGATVGYTLPFAIYGGVRPEYFFGTNEQKAGRDTQTSLAQFSLEAGYDIGVGSEVVLRVKAGGGMASVERSSCVIGELGQPVCEGGKNAGFALLPGVTFVYLGRDFSLTYDVRYELVAVTPRAQGVLFFLGFGF